MQNSNINATEQNSDLDEYHREMDQLRVTIEQQNEHIQTLQHQLEWFKRQLFGEKSEKRDMADNPY